MKTFWKILGWIVGIGILTAMFVIGYQNRGFFKTYFDQKQQKLELRTEKSVDSLLNVIAMQDLKISELDSVNEAIGLKFDQYMVATDLRIDSITKHYETDRTKLLNVITHQNQMIDKLNAQLGGKAYD